MRALSQGSIASTLGPVQRCSAARAALKKTTMGIAATSSRRTFMAPEEGVVLIDVAFSAVWFTRAPKVGKCVVLDFRVYP